MIQEFWAKRPLLPEQIRCPKCGRGFWLKPPYNTVDECMVCRHHREHGTEEYPQ